MISILDFYFIGVLFIKKLGGHKKRFKGNAWFHLVRRNMPAMSFLGLKNLLVSKFSVLLPTPQPLQLVTLVTYFGIYVSSYLSKLTRVKYKEVRFMIT